MIKRLSILSLVFLFIGCSTPPKVRGPSEYLMATDQNVETLLTKIQEKLESYKYVAKRLDPAAGILIFEPRRFTYDSGGETIGAEQTIHIRQEGGSVKLRIKYDCEYTESSYVPCSKNDQQVQAKVKRLEASLMAAIRPLLLKHTEAPDEFAQ